MSAQVTLKKTWFGEGLLIAISTNCGCFAKEFPIGKHSSYHINANICVLSVLPEEEPSWIQNIVLI